MRLKLVKKNKNELRAKLGAGSSETKNQNNDDLYFF